MSFDIDVIEAPGANGSYNSAFHEKAKAIAEAVTTGGYSFGFLHVKAVDDTGHDRRVAMKVGPRPVISIICSGTEGGLSRGNLQHACPFLLGSVALGFV